MILIFIQKAWWFIGFTEREAVEGLEIFYLLDDSFNFCSCYFTIDKIVEKRGKIMN